MYEHSSGSSMRFLRSTAGATRQCGRIMTPGSSPSPPSRRRAQFAACERRTLRKLPRRLVAVSTPGLRPAVRAIYWFARTADDIADEGDAPRRGAPGDAAPPIATTWLKAAAGQARLGPLGRRVRSARRASSRRTGCPLPLLAALLDAFEEDTRHAGYADRAALLQYCSPLGQSDRPPAAALARHRRPPAAAPAATRSVPRCS